MATIFPEHEDKDKDKEDKTQKVRSQRFMLIVLFFRSRGHERKLK